MSVCGHREPWAGGWGAENLLTHAPSAPRLTPTSHARMALEPTTQGAALWVAKPLTAQGWDHPLISWEGASQLLAPFLLTNAKGAARCGCSRSCCSWRVEKLDVAACLGNPLLREGVCQSRLTRLMQKSSCAGCAPTGHLQPLQLLPTSGSSKERSKLAANLFYLAWLQSAPCPSPSTNSCANKAEGWELFAVEILIRSESGGNGFFVEFMIRGGLLCGGVGVFFLLAFFLSFSLPCPQ